MRFVKADLFFLSVLLFLVPLSGCGRKSQPIPLYSLTPAAIEDLSYSTSERGLILTWSSPDQTTSGEPLTTLEGFEILRAEVRGDACDGCPLPFETVAMIPAVPRSKANPSGITTFRQDFLQAGYRYYYKVRANNGGPASGRDSNTISFLWENPPHPAP